jgi:hypothetical protein
MACPRQGGLEEPAGGGLGLLRRQVVAAAMVQPLTILELAQLGGRVDLDVGIAADSKPEHRHLHHWLDLARDRISFRGLWADLGDGTGWVSPSTTSSQAASSSLPSSSAATIRTAAASPA